MKLIILTVLCFGTVCVRGVGDCDAENHYPEGCFDVDNIAKISCPEGSPCTCTMTIDDVTMEQGDCTTDILPETNLDDLPSITMSGEECRNLCEASKSIGGDSVCEYFRWEKDAIPGSSDTEHCTLMKKGQCIIYEPCGEPEKCQSGQAGCTTDDNPGPEGATCKSDVDFIEETGAVHWKCINPFDEEGTHIDIYGHDPVPSGTICWTVRRCFDFDTEPADEDPELFVYRTLVVQCNDPDPDLTVDDGQWVKYHYSTNDISSVISEGVAANTLSDPKCLVSPKQLVLDAPTLHKPGVSFICSKQDPDHFESNAEHVTIKEDNTCALLCNFHHVMTIEPKFVESDGTKKFWKYTTGEGDVGEEAKSENVYCWSPPPLAFE